jgi:hypothetical protein
MNGPKPSAASSVRGESQSCNWSDQARNEMAAAGGPVTVTGNRDATVGHIRVAFLNHIGRYVGVARARYAVALARDVAANKTHRRRTSFNLAVVVGVIADAYQVHHGASRRLIHACRLFRSP